MDYFFESLKLYDNINKAKILYYVILKVNVKFSVCTWFRRKGEGKYGSTYS